MSRLRSRSRRNRAARSLVLGALAAVSAASQAQGNYWSGNGDGLYWDSMANWSLGSPSFGQWLYIGYDDWMVRPRPVRTEIRTGDFNVARLYSTSDLTISGGSLHLTDTAESGLIGARFVLSGGQLINDGALGVKDLTLGGGTLSGTGSLNVTNSAEVTGAANWVSGTISLASGTTLDVRAGATLYANSGTVLSGGTLANAGDLRFSNYNSYNAWNVDALDNSGTLSRTDNYGSVGIVAGIVTNSGTIATTSYYSGNLNVASTGGFTNSGTVASNGTYYGRLNTSAAGDYLNSGTLSSGGYYDADLSARAEGGAFTNTGTIQSYGTTYYADIRVFGKTGLTNQGAVDLRSGNYGSITLDSDGNIENAVGGQILNRGDYSNTLNSTAGGSWTNHGTVAATGYYAYLNLSAGGDLLNDGTLAANANATYLSALAGGAFKNLGTVEKHGWGEIHLGGAGGSDNSGGTILVDGGGNSAYVWLDRNWDVDTLGTLTALNGGSFRLAGTLDNSGHSLDMTALAGGAFWLDGGTVKGGSVDATKLRLTRNGGNTLDSVQLDGGFSLIGDKSLRLRDTPIPSGVAVNIGDPNYSQWGYATLALDQDQVLSGNVLTMAGYPSAILYVENGHTLTVGADSSIVGDSVRVYGTTGTESLVNHGLIRTRPYYANSSEIGSSMALVHNAADGTIIADGVTTTISAASLHNEGLIQALGGAGLYLYGALDNDGSIRANGAGTLVRLHGAFANDPLTGLSWNDVKATNGGELQLSGSLANAGATFDPVAAAGDGTFRLVGGSIAGGSILHSDDLRFAGGGNVFDGVALDGGINLGEAGPNLTLRGGTALGLNPTVKVGPRDGYYYNGNAALYAEDGLALVGADVQFGTNYYRNDLVVYGGHDLSLDAATTMSGRFNVSGSGGTLTNAGLISAEGGSGYEARIGDGFASFVNSGTLRAKDFGAPLYVYGDLANSGSFLSDHSDVRFYGSTLTNTGAVRAIHGGYLALYNALDNGGTIRAEGAGARIALFGSYATGDWNDLKAVGGGSVELGGYLDNSAQAGYDLNDLVEAGGTFRLTGGRISGGGLVNSGMLRYDGNGSNTLSGVTLDSDLDLSEPGSVVTLRNGTTMPSSPTIKIGQTADYYAGRSQLRLGQDTDLADTTVEFGQGYYENYLRMLEGHDLTVEADSTLRGRLYLYADSSASDLVNRGLISVEGTGGGYSTYLGSGFGTVENAAGATIQAKDLGANLYLYGNGFHNAGTLTADASAIYFYGGSLQNDGLVQATRGGYFELNNLAVGGGLGSILADGAGSRVRLNGNFTTSALGTVRAQAGGEIQLGGNLDNTGDTLDLGTVAADGTFRLTGGGIGGGNVVASDHLRFDGNYSNYLAGATLDHGLSLEEYGASLRLFSLGDPGDDAIRIGREAHLSFADGQTFDGTILLMSQGTTGYTRYVHVDNGAALTLGPNATIRNEDGGGYASLFDSRSGAAGSVLNQGLISAGTDASFNLYGATITNAGTIEARDGGYLALYPAHLNNATGTLQAAGAGSRLRLGLNLATGQLGHTVATGGGEIQLAAALDNAGATLDLNAIAADGTFRVVDGGGIVGGNVANSGALRFNASAYNYLSGVSTDGDLDLSQYGSFTRVFDSLSVGGKVDLGPASNLVFANAQTFGGHIQAVEGDYPGSYYGRSIRVDNGSTLTLAPSAVIDSQGTGYTYLFESYFGAAGTVLNGGRITAGPLARFYLQGNTVTNSGTVEAKDGGYLQIDTTHFTNPTGTLQATGAGSVVYVARDMATGSLGHVVAGDGGELQLGARLDNAGATLDLGAIAATGAVRVVNGGGIVGGSVVNSDALRFNGSYWNYLQNVDLDGGLDLSAYYSVVRSLGGVSLGGTVRVGQESEFVFATSQTFDGHLQMDGAVSPNGTRYVRIDNGSTLTLGPNAVIDSAGGGSASLFNPWYYGPAGSVVNRGSILAGTGARFYVGNVPLSNTGTVGAKDGGYLQFDYAGYDGAGGKLSATGAGSVVRLYGGNRTSASLGSLVASGGGEIVIPGGTTTNTGATLDLSGVTAGGRVRVTENGSLVGGSVLNSGALHFDGYDYNSLVGVTLDSGLDLSDPYSRVRLYDSVTTAGGSYRVGRESILNFANDQTFHGAIQLVESDASYGTRRVIVDGATHLTLAADASITSVGAGYGQLFGGWNVGGENSTTNGGLVSVGTGASWDLYGSHLVNSGTIRADGGTLAIRSGDVLNSGALAATNGGNLYSNRPTTNANGRIVANTGGVVRLAGAMSNAGSTLDLSGVTGTGVVRLVENGAITGGSIVNSRALRFDGYDSNTLSGVALDSGLDLSDPYSRARLYGVTTQGGTFDVGRESFLNFADSQTFHGDIRMVEGDNAGGTRRVIVDGASALTLAADSTLTSVGNGYSQLFGNWNVGGENSTTNQGLISAGSGATFQLYGSHLTNAGTIQADGGTLYLDPGTFANSGLVTAKNGGYLRFTGRTVGNAGGRIKLDGGGTVNLDGSTVTGGRIEGSSVRRASYDYNNVYDGVTVDSGLKFDNYNFLRVKNGLNVESGTVDFNGYESGLVFDGDQTFDGAIRLNSGGWSHVGAEGTTKLTLGPNSSIAGAGAAQIGRHWNTGGANAVTNAGTIQAQSGANWYLNSEAFTNAGTLDVSAGATVQVTGSSFHQTAGHTDVSGHLYASSPFNVDGGSLTGTGTVHGSLVNGGFLQPSTGVGSLSITGDFAQTSTGALDLSISGLDTFGSLLIGGTATLGGALNVGFLNGYSPNPGDTFRLLNFAHYGGGTFSLNAADPSYTYALSYSDVGAFLTVAGAPGYVYWIGNGSNTTADWATPGVWSSYPVATDKVVNGYADRAIVHSTGTDTIQSLKSAGALTLSGGTLAANSPASSTLQVNNAFTLSGGTLKGFTVQAGTGGQGVTVQGSGSVIDGANVLADVSVDGSSLGLANGARLRGTTAIANGGAVTATTDLTLSEGLFAFSGYGDGRLSAGSSVLTLNGATFSGDRVHVASGAGGKVVNAGTLNASGSGAAWTVDPATLDNAGFLKATNGGHLALAPNAYARLGDATADGAGSLLDLMGGTVDFSTASLHALNGGTIRLGTVLDLSGGTADGAALAGSGTFLVDGTIRHGSLSNLGALTFSSSGFATLDDVNVVGGLTLGGSERLRLANSVGGGPITLNDYARLGFATNASLANTVLRFNGYYTGFDLFDGAALSLGDGLTIVGSGKIDGPASGHATLTLNGSLGLYSGGGLRVDPTDVTVAATGALLVGNGGEFTMQGGTFTNDANDPAAGHVVRAFSGGSLDLAPDHFVNNGAIQVGSVTTANLRPATWDRVGSLAANGSNAVVRLGGGTLSLGAGDLLHAQDGGGFRLETTLDNAGRTLDPEAIGGDFILNGGTIRGGLLNTGSSYLGFTNAANILDGVTFVPGAGLTLNGGHAIVRNDVINGAGLWRVEAGGDLTFEASRQFSGQTFLIDNGALRSVADVATPGIAPNIILGNGTIVTGKNANIEAVNMTSLSRLSSEAGGNWYVNVADQLQSNYFPDHPERGAGTIEAGTNSALYLHAGRFANNNVILSKQGGWLDATADVWSRVGTVQSTGAGSNTVLRGGTVVIGLSDGLYAYNGGAIRLGTTLDNTGNWLNPGLANNTYVNGAFTVGYNGDGAHGGFWGRVKGGGIDSESFLLRFENAELENVSLTTADPAQDGSGNFLHLAGLDLHNEHVRVLGNLKSNGDFRLTDGSSLYFDGSRDFHDVYDTSGEIPNRVSHTQFTFAGTGNAIGLLGAGTLDIGDGTTLTGQAGSSYTVDMAPGGTLNLNAGSSVSGPGVSISGGTLNNHIAMGPNGAAASWSLSPTILNNDAPLSAANGGSLSIGTGTLNNGATISAANGSSLSVSAGTLANAGTISASTGSRLSVSATTLDNHRIDVGGAGYAELYGGTWTGVGSVTSTGASTVRLAGGLTNDGSLDTRLQAGADSAFTLGFGRYRPAGVVANAGQTFDPNHTGGTFTLDVGHIVGGDLVVTGPSGAALPIFASSYWDYYYGHDDNLLDGARLVDEGGSLTALDLTNGGTVSVANMAAPWNNGQYRLDNGARLSYNTDSPLASATVSLGTHGTSVVNPYGSTLTIADSVTFSGKNGVVGEYYPGYQPTNRIVNHADIASHDGGSWSVAPHTLENHGTLSASNGSTLAVTPYVWAKLGLVSVTDPNSVLYLGVPGQGLIERQDPSDDFQFSNGGRIVLGAHLINQDAAGNPLTIDAIANDGYFEVRGGTIEDGAIRVNTPTDRSLSADAWLAGYGDPRFLFTPGYSNALKNVALKDGTGAPAGLDLRNGSSVRILGSLSASNGFLLANGANLSFEGNRDFSGANAATFHFTNGGTVGADGLLTLGAGSAVDGAAIVFGGGGLKNEVPIVGTSSLYIGSGTLTNDSTIGIANGGTATLAPGTWTRVGNLRSDGAGSLMRLAGGAMHPDWANDTIRASGGGAFELNTTLDNGTNVGPFDPDVIGGRFTVSGGTILNGSVVSLSPDLRLPSATFDGVRLVTAGGALSGLDLDAGERLTIRGAFDDTTRSSGQYAIADSSLTFANDANRTLGAASHFSVTDGQINQSYGATLTLDGSSVQGTGVRIGDSWWYGYNTGGLSLTANTHLAAGGAGNVWAVTPYALRNDGSLAAQNGAAVYATVADWQKAGSLSATGAGSRLVLDGGTILDAGGAFSPAATAGAQIEVRNVIDNVGSFLNPDALGGGALQIGGSDYAYIDNYGYTKSGTIRGGALNTASSHLVFTHEPMDHSWATGYDNVLDGVALTTADGTTAAGLDLSNGGTVRLANGYSLNGQYALDRDARITFGDDKTFGNGSSFAFGANGGGTLAVWDHRVLRFEGGVSLTGPQATITGDDASRFVNATTFGPTGAGSLWTISTSIADNQGALAATDGATLAFATNVTNHAGRTIAANGGTVRFEGPAPTRGQVSNLGTLSTANGGRLEFSNNAQLANTGTVSVHDGALNLDTSSIVNTGTITFDDGALNLTRSSVTSAVAQTWNLSRFTLDASSIVGTTSLVALRTTESNGAYFMFSPSRDNFFDKVDFKVSSASNPAQLGVMDLSNGGYLRVRDSVISAHEIVLGNGGSLAFDHNVAIAADQLTFQGGGSTLDLPMAPGSSLTFVGGMTVQGVIGSIGGQLPGTPPSTQPRDFVNEAAILVQNNLAADGAASIDSTSFKNTGSVKVDNGGKIVLNADTVNAGVFESSLGSNITIGNGFVQTAGLLINNGTIDIAPGNLLEITGGTIKGNGTVNGQVVNGSRLNVGNSPGHMTINGEYTATASSTFVLEVAGLDQGISTGYDWLDVNGNVALGGTLSLSLLGGYDFTGSADYTFLTYSGALTGAFDTFDMGGADLHGGSLSLVYGSGKVGLKYQAVPEPGSLLAVGAGLAAFAARRRRRAR